MAALRMKIARARFGHGSVFAQTSSMLFPLAFIAAVRTPALPTMSEQRVRDRRRAGRPPAGAKEGEKVKDYPQLSIRVPLEFKARLNALSAVTGLAQWRVIVEAINCFFSDLPQTDQELVDGLSERLMRAGQA
ncbi:MAG: hypothetical protein JF601_07045 [Acidobacteria bacterium]|nr:hypothetical protein [Acidobacteriota bacterium]